MFWFKKMVNNVRQHGGIMTIIDPLDAQSLAELKGYDKLQDTDVVIDETKNSHTHTLNIINKSKTIKPNTERFYELIKQAEIFVAPPMQTDPDISVKYEGGETYIRDKKISPEDLDLPFHTVTFEMHAHAATIDGYADELGPVLLHVPCMLVHEPEPRKLEVYIWLAIQHKWETHAEAMLDSRVVKLSKGHPHYAPMMMLLTQYLEKLAVYKVGEEKVKEHVKIGSGHRKESFTIRRVLHIHPKRVEGNIPHLTGRKIEWSHRWTVRGHWVRFIKDGKIDYTRIGKNREGERCIAGYTWRSDHTKGPEDAPLIKKIRVIDNE